MIKQFLLIRMFFGLATLPLLGMDREESIVSALTQTQLEKLQHLNRCSHQLLTGISKPLIEKQLQQFQNATSAAKEKNTSAVSNVTLEAGGQEFIVSKNIIEECETIKMMLEEMGDEMPLTQQVSPQALENLLRLLYLHHHVANSNKKQKKQTTIDALTRLQFEELAALLETANYLEAPKILLKCLKAECRKRATIDEKTDRSDPRFWDAFSSLANNNDLQLYARSSIPNLGCQSVSIPGINYFAWSPTNDCIGVTAYDKEKKQSTLYLVDRDGSKTELCSLSGERWILWSPNGAFIAAIKLGFYELTLISKDGKQKMQISTNEFERLVWCSDSSLVISQSIRYPDYNTCPDMLIQRFSIAEAENLLAGIKYNPLLNFSPDRKFFVVPDDDKFNASTKGLYIHSTDGKIKIYKPLKSPAHISAISWHPDSSHFAMGITFHQQRPKIFLISPQSGQVEQEIEVSNNSSKSIGIIKWNPKRNEGGPIMAVRLMSYPSYKKKICLIYEDGSRQKIPFSDNILQFYWNSDGSSIIILPEPKTNSHNYSLFRVAINNLTKNEKIFQTSATQINVFGFKSHESGIVVRPWYDKKCSLSILAGGQEQKVPLVGTVHAFASMSSCQCCCNRLNSDPSCSKCFCYSPNNKYIRTHLCNPEPSPYFYLNNQRPLIVLSDYSEFNSQSDLAIKAKDRLLIFNNDVLTFFAEKITPSQIKLLELFQHSLKNRSTDCLAQLPRSSVDVFHTLPDNIKDKLPDNIKDKLPIKKTFRLINQNGILLFCWGKDIKG